MLIVIGSVKGSPGVSCLTAGVAVFLQGGSGSVLVIEADPGGGVAAVRSGLGAHPGMASLAIRTRGAALAAASVAEHVQVLGSGAGVLVGPVAGDEASSGLDVLADPLARFARSRPDGELLLADVGRMDPDSAAAPLVSAADGVVLVTHADREGLEQAASWLRTAGELNGRIAVVTRQPPTGLEYSPREIADGLGVQVLGRLPHDETATTAFASSPRWASRGDRRRGGWWRAVVQVSERVAQLRPLVSPEPMVASIRGIPQGERPGADHVWPADSR